MYTDNEESGCVKYMKLKFGNTFTSLYLKWTVTNLSHKRLHGWLPFRATGFTKHIVLQSMNEWYAEYRLLQFN